MVGGRKEEGKRRLEIRKEVGKKKGSLRQDEGRITILELFCLSTYISISGNIIA